MYPDIETFDYSKYVGIQRVIQICAMKKLLLLPLLILLANCATNPVTGKRELSLISEESEISIGTEQYLPSQQSQGGIYKVDPELTAYVNEVGQRVAAQSDRQLPYEFVVLNNGVPNAWALPGGKIAINRGLLTKLENEAELAAVLGHEVVHSAAKHGAKSMQRNAIIQGAVMAAAIGASASDSEYGNYIVGGAELGAKLIVTKYGRNAELESDFYGTNYMAQAGYDPEGAITLQEKFVAFSEGRETSWVDGLFASHPPSEERVLKNAETAAGLKTTLTSDLDLGTERFQQKLAYIRSKEDAYQIFDQARSLAANNKLDIALRTVNNAIGKESKDARFFGLRGDIYLEKRQYEEALAAYNKALELDDAYYEYYLGRGLVSARQGNRAAAKDDLEKSNALLPTAVAMNELGQLSLAAGNTQQAKSYFQNALNAGGQVGASAREAYTRLDMPSNPAAYFKTEPSIVNGKVAVLVANTSPISVQSLSLQVAALINGEEVYRTITTPAIAAGQQIRISTGITASEALQDLRVSVTNPRL